MILKSPEELKKCITVYIIIIIRLDVYLLQCDMRVLRNDNISHTHFIHTWINKLFDRLYEYFTTVSL